MVDKNSDLSGFHWGLFTYARKPDFSRIISRILSSFRHSGLKKLESCFMGMCWFLDLGWICSWGLLWWICITSFSRMRDARKVFDGIPERDGVLWNAVITGMMKSPKQYRGKSKRDDEESLLGWNN